MGIDDKVGCDLLQAPAYGLAQRGAWPWVQLAQFVEELFGLRVAQCQTRLYLVPVLTRKLLEIVSHHRRHLFLQFRGVLTGYLQQ